MPRYFYGGFLILLVIALVFVYRTSHTEVSKETTPARARFGEMSLRIDYATTSVAREKGLGGRTSIESDYGMLFVFNTDGLYGFWMKDTLIPLDMFWIDNKGQVISISENVATSSFPHVFYPASPARYVLETIAGFSREHAIATGTPLHLKNIPTVSE